MLTRGSLPQPGFRFKDGTLYVFTDESITLVHGWPRLEAARKRVIDAHWEPFEPEFPLVRPYRRPSKRSTAARRSATQLALPIALPRRMSLAEQRRRAFAAFRFALPTHLAPAVEPLTSGQWPVLHLVRDAPPALDLLQANPALAFALAQRTRDAGDCSPDVAPVLVTRRQREIMGALGFPASEAAANVLRKLAAASVSARTLESLHAALRDTEAAKLLAHAERLNAGAVALIAEPRLRRMTAPSLLAEVQASRREMHYPFAAERLEAALGLADTLGESIARRRLGSLQALATLYEELGARFCATHSDRILSCRFGRPPIPGTSEIVPLTSPAALIAEGEAQRNCVATYALRVESRSTYIYRVLKPERATLSLVRGPSGAWERDELFRAGNQPVSARTIEAVDRWLDHHAF